MVANYIPEGMNIVLQSENGLLGIGEFPTEEHVDADLINAGKQTITTTQGASFFSSSESFAMIRGGHINLSILGALEVAENGDLANWMIPGKMVKGMGGAMDLVASARRVVVLMTLTNKRGDAKILKKCNLPLTGEQVVDRIITEKAVFDIIDGKCHLIEVAKGVSVEEIKSSVDADLIIGDVREMDLI